MPPNEVTHILEKRAQASVDEAAKEVPSELVDSRRIAIGTPWQAICRAATEYDVDVIVIGSHGYDVIDRVLGTTAAQRFGSLPDTPTVAEAGLPGYALYPWLGMFVPAKTPPEIVARINAEITRILATEEVKARLVPQGMDLATGSPAELAKIIREDHAHWGKVLREAGVRAE